MLFGEQLARVPEAHFMHPHHPVDHAAAGIAAKAVPQVRLRRDDAARGIVSVMPRTTTGQVLALHDELVALRLDEARQTYLALQPLQRLVRDTCHAVPPKTGVAQ